MGGGGGGGQPDGGRGAGGGDNLMEVEGRWGGGGGNLMEVEGPGFGFWFLVGPPEATAKPKGGRRKIAAPHRPQGGLLGPARVGQRQAAHDSTAPATGGCHRP